MAQELFDLLDDGDGGIETKEFFHGLARMKGGWADSLILRTPEVEAAFWGMGFEGMPR